MRNASARYTAKMASAVRATAESAQDLATLVIRRHLLFDGRVQPTLSAAETKTSRPYVAVVPQELTDCIIA